MLTVELSSEDVRDIIDAIAECRAELSLGLPQADAFDARLQSIVDRLNEQVWPR